MSMTHAVLVEPEWRLSFFKGVMRQHLDPPWYKGVSFGVLAIKSLLLSRLFIWVKKSDAGHAEIAIFMPIKHGKNVTLMKNRYCFALFI